MELTNYKMKDFLKQGEETFKQYNTALQFLQPTDTNKRLMDMPLRFVEYVKKTIPSATFVDMIDMIAHLQGVEEKEIREMKVVDFYGLMKSLVKQTVEIVQNEEKRLTPKHPNPKWELVNGAGKMSPFGIYLTLDKLSGGDILKWDAILDQPYSRVMTKLFMDTVKADIEHDIAQLETQKR